ncbi:hydrolase [Streptomyces sp. BBFR115]|uniref:hydrolase n=1 Tax=Streptomyces sp. BBFR115 TaxID=3448173 RepID=UPI003F758A2F
MRSPHPPPPPYPPRPGGPPAESDDRLIARLRDPDGGHHAVALLLARHWRATYDYAVVCLAAPGDSAAVVATAAFRRVLRRPAGGPADGPGGRALRPRLLVAARETVRQWAADETACAVLPELRRPSGGRGLRAVRSFTPEKRRLAELAFHDLPDALRCLLWHTEVEAEPITVPAGLLAMTPETAAGLRAHAREQFRAGCVRVHRELAPTARCRVLGPLLLDASAFGSGPPPPGARRHLRECRHCAYAAEQLGHFEGGLDVLLAEAVLGWGARRYLDSRAARNALGGGDGPYAAGPDRTAGGPGSHGGATGDVGREGGAESDGQGVDRQGAAEQWRRHRTAVAVGAGLASLVLIAGVPGGGGCAEDRSVPVSRAAWSVPGGGGGGVGVGVGQDRAGTPSPARSAPSATPFPSTAPSAGPSVAPVGAAGPDRDPVRR